MPTSLTSNETEKVNTKDFIFIHRHSLNSIESVINNLIEHNKGWEPVGNPFYSNGIWTQGMRCHRD